MGLIRDVCDYFRPNPLDTMLEALKKKSTRRVLLVWNRGLGDIALGLYAMVYRIKELLPEADITFLTRCDLKDGFKLLEGVKVLSVPSWERGQVIDVDEALKGHDLSKDDFDLMIEKPDPTRWTKWQLETLVPKLHWTSESDALADEFNLEDGKAYVGMHVHTETGQYYGYEKNWPLKYWHEFARRLTQEKGKGVVLFGLNQDPAFNIEGVVDLRGKTNLFQMLSIVKNRLDCLVVPDSGVLCLAYYLNETFPLKIVSLWSDPRQGVLKQNVSSPNPDLVHIPLIGRDENVANISVEKVLQAVES